MGDGNVAVLVKVVPTRVDIDPLSGVPTIDVRFLGVSAADRAAVAVALALAHDGGGAVDLYCVAPPTAEGALLEFAALGVRRTVRVALSGDEGIEPAQWLAAYPSELVARVLSDVIGRPDYVVAGDHSLDRGSASVPARLAERLQYAQALGLLEVDVERLVGTRRLDAGWRENVRLRPESVVSVEASAGRLARAGLGALREVELEVASLDVPVEISESVFAPYRPAPEVVAPPREKLAARRAMEVIGALTPARRREVIELAPNEAADVILERLASWGMA